MLDTVPFIRPVPPLERAELEQLPVVDDLMRIESPFGKDIVVRLEDGQESICVASCALYDSFEELYLVGGEASKLGN